MNTSLNIKSVEQSSGRKLQKTITDVNPNADGTALKTWAQGLNNLTTNRYVGTTKINIDNLLEEDTGGGGSGAVNPLPAPTVVLSYINTTNLNTFGIRSCEFTNAAAYLTISDSYWPTIGLCTNSSGNLHVTHTPSNAGANLLKGITIQAMQSPANLMLLPKDDLPTEIAAITNPKCWMIAFSCPNATDSNCFGEFTFVLDATDEHSSATITINIQNG